MKIFILLFTLFSSLFSMQQIIKEGEVLVNNNPIDMNTMIQVGDTIETKGNSTVRFVINKNAFMLNPDTKLKIIGDKTKQVLNVITGGVLAVFEPNSGEYELKTPNMTAGIRGTGVFIEAKEDKTYFCTCYGKTHLHNHSTNTTKDVTSTHHDMYWFTQNEIKPTKDMESHNDEQLRVLEKMVGRVPYFDK